MDYIRLNKRKILNEFVKDYPKYKDTVLDVVISPVQYFIVDENKKQVSDSFYADKDKEFSTKPLCFGYARVSTKIQATDGNSLESQEQQLTDAGASIIYKDAFTGTKSERPELDKLKDQLIPGDKVIVTKLDRLARSTEDGLALIKEWNANNITVHVLNMGCIDNTPTGRLILTVMLAFAEFERDMILERTQEGRAIARLNPDYKEGRKKKYTKQQIEHAMELLKTNSYMQVSNMTGISKSTLIRERKIRDYDDSKGMSPLILELKNDGYSDTEILDGIVENYKNEK